MAEKYVITDTPRVSKIKTTSAIKKWSPDGVKVFYFLDIDFENGDTVKLMESDFTKLMKYNEGKRYYYELTRVTTIDDDNQSKTTYNFKYIEELISDYYKSRIKRVDETLGYIKLSAKLSVGSMQGQFTDEQFKDRFRTIFDTMKTALYLEDFGELEGDDLDAFMKDNDFNI